LALALAVTLTTISPTAQADTADNWLDATPGRWTQVGGLTGWVNANAAALEDRLLDPTSVRSVTASSTLQGPSATIKLPASWQSGLITGDATGQVNFRATDVDVALATDYAFFTQSDLLNLMPTLTFTVATFNISNNRLQYWGHYALDMATGRVDNDDKRTNTPPNGHDRLTVSNSSRLDDEIMTDATLNTMVSQSLATLVTPGAAQLNEETQRIYRGYAAAYADRANFNLGSAAVPYAFAYQPSADAAGQTISLDSTDLISQPGSWLADLDGQTTAVPFSFTEFDWRNAVSAETEQTLAGSPVASAFDQAFAQAFDYDRLVTTINQRTDAQLTEDIHEMVTGFVNGFSQSIAKWSEKRLPGPASHPEWYIVLRMDQLQGITSFPNSKQASQVMYPNLVADTTAKIVKIVRERVSSKWYTPVRANLTGTATVTKTFTPGSIEHLQALSLAPLDPSRIPTRPSASPATSASPEPEPSPTTTAPSPTASSQPVATVPKALAAFCQTNGQWYQQLSQARAEMTEASDLTTLRWAPAIMASALTDFTTVGWPKTFKPIGPDLTEAMTDWQTALKSGKDRRLKRLNLNDRRSDLVAQVTELVDLLATTCPNSTAAAPTLAPEPEPEPEPSFTTGPSVTSGFCSAWEQWRSPMVAAGDNLTAMSPSAIAAGLDPTTMTSQTTVFIQGFAALKQSDWPKSIRSAGKDLASFFDDWNSAAVKLKLKKLAPVAENHDIMMDHWTDFRSQLDGLCPNAAAAAVSAAADETDLALPPTVEAQPTPTADLAPSSPTPSGLVSAAGNDQLFVPMSMIMTLLENMIRLMLANSVSLAIPQL
jgi:hypothetical protein